LFIFIFMDTAFASLAFIDGVGAPEMMLIFVLILVLFGGDKLPPFARGLGKSIREFKKAAAGLEEEFKRALDEDERKHTTPQLTAAASTAPNPTDAAGPDAATHHPDEYHHDYDHDYHSQHPEIKSETPSTDATAAGAPPSGDPTPAEQATLAAEPASPPTEHGIPTDASLAAPAPSSETIAPEPAAPAPIVVPTTPPQTATRPEQT
jgi:sec-independent protein translocase protein TatA